MEPAEATQISMGDKRYGSLSREGAWVIFGNIASIVGSLLGIRILTELLNPSTYGELSLGITIATLVGQTIFGPLGNGSVRFYAIAQEKHEVGSYLGALWRLILYANTILLVTAIVGGSALVISGHFEYLQVFLVSVLYGSLLGLFSLLYGVQNAARQRSIAALHQGIEPWARYSFAAAMVMVLGATSVSVLAGYALALCLIIGSQRYFFLRTHSRELSDQAPSKVWITEIWRYAWPFAGWGIFTWAQMASDRWALALFSSTREVGLYAALFQIGYYPLSTVTTMALQFLSPIFFQKAGSGQDKSRQAAVSTSSQRLSWIALATTGIAFMLGLFFHKLIFSIFVGEKYSSVSYLLPWIMLGGGLFSTGQLISLNLLSKMKSREMVTCKIGTAMIGILLNIMGATFLGIQGIIAANIGFSFIYLLWIREISRKADREMWTSNLTV